MGVPRVQGEPVKLPVPLLAKETVPVGALAVPPEESVTVAVQFDGEFTPTEVGEHVTSVVVALFVTATSTGPELAP